MLDPTLCNRPISQWIGFKQWLIMGFLNEPIIYLILGLVIVGGWKLPWRPWNKIISASGTILLLGYILMALPPVIELANSVLVKTLPRDPGSTADAIVVLGRGDDLRQNRVQTATQLWHAQRAPHIFVSGQADGPLISDLLISEGIPVEVIDHEGCSRSTEENARFTALLLQPKGIKDIILVTDPPHMLRSVLNFRSSGFTVIPYTSPLPALSPRQQGLMMFYEYAGMLSYAIQGRFQPQ